MSINQCVRFSHVFTARPLQQEKDFVVDANVHTTAVSNLLNLEFVAGSTDQM